MSFDKYIAHNNMLRDGEMDFSKECQKAVKGKKEQKQNFIFFFFLLSIYSFIFY